MSFLTYSGSHLKSFLSQAKERIVVGAMSKRGQDTTSSDSSPVAKARPTNLVMHSQCKEDVSPQSSGSRVNPENDDERKSWPSLRKLGTFRLKLRSWEFPSVSTREG